MQSMNVWMPKTPLWEYERVKDLLWGYTLEEAFPWASDHLLSNLRETKTECFDSTLVPRNTSLISAMQKMDRESVVLFTSASEATVRKYPDILDLVGLVCCGCKKKSVSWWQQIQFPTGTILYDNDKNVIHLASNKGISCFLVETFVS